MLRSYCAAMQVCLPTLVGAWWWWSIFIQEPGGTCRATARRSPVSQSPMMLRYFSHSCSDVGGFAVSPLGLEMHQISTQRA